MYEFYEEISYTGDGYVIGICTPLITILQNIVPHVYGKHEFEYIK